jgi:TetR/AcrR family transcriptional regulator, lmrAB and yxaGH operons repressor
MPSTSNSKSDDLRAAMVNTAARWLPQRGMAAVNLIEVARSVQAPRGSIYYYFPGGRDQLLSEALALANQSGLRMIDKVAARSADPQALVEGVFAASGRWLDANFSGGCPIGAAVVSAETESEKFGQAIQACFKQWEDVLTKALRSKGVTSPARARELAQCMLIGFEGAMLYAKGTHRTTAFDLAARMVLGMLHNSSL